MKDLDMSDVIADGERMHQAYLDTMYRDFEAKSETELREMRYAAGQLARQGNIYAIDVVEMIDHILLTTIITELCEGCWDRYGCDMCCPPEFDPMYDIPWGTPDSWIPDNPNEDGFRQSDFI